MTTDPIEYLFSLERLGMKFGLESIARLCSALGNPQDAFRSVVIGGTNGKGSVTAMVSTALGAAGHRTARYTSPHLERLEERFVIDGREVGADDLRAAASRVQDAIVRLQRSGVLAAPPTFFECATAIAFDLFRAAAVEIAVLEVGLGGRLDATNVVTPALAAIASIDFDHEALLGHTLGAIAFEKAGIIKPGIPVVVGQVPDEAMRVIATVCAERGARLVAIDRRSFEAIDEVTGGDPLALAGAHQRGNAAVALGVLRELDAMGIRVGREHMRAGLCDVRWPARLERLSRGGCEVLLDAAHNPAGARALADYLRSIGWSGVPLVFGAMQDKDVAAIIEPLAAVSGRVICTTAPTPRAMPAAALAEAARKVQPAPVVEAIADPAAALEHACAVSRRVVAAGSIFLVGPLRGILRA